MSHPMRKVRPILDRIVSKLDVGDCWVFTGALCQGYGMIGVGRRDQGTALVHRAMWEMLVGPIPDGLDLYHMCRNRACCNPDHLQPVKRTRTHCVHGHEYTPENTIRSPRQRRCRTCIHERARALRDDEMPGPVEAARTVAVAELLASAIEHSGKVVGP